jgi:hypothetical protein
MNKLRLQIKRFIVNRQLQQALELAHTLPNIDFHNELIILESRLNDVNQRLASGLIVRDDYTCEINNIALGILNLTDDGVTYSQPQALGVAAAIDEPTSEVCDCQIDARLIYAEPRRKDFIVNINGVEHRLSLRWGFFSSAIYWDDSQIEAEKGLGYWFSYNRSVFFKIKSNNQIHKARFLIETSMLTGNISVLKLFINETETYHLA